MATKPRVKLPGSERKAMAGAKAGKTVDASDQIEVTVRVRGRAQASPEALMKIGAQKPAERQTLSREDFAARYGADRRISRKWRHSRTTTAWWYRRRTPGSGQSG